MAPVFPLTPKLRVGKSEPMTIYRGGHPALNWLAKNDPDAALAVLQRLRDGEPQTYVEPSTSIASGDDAEAHGVLEEPVTFGELTEAAQDGPDEVAPEMLHDDQPSERHLLAAIGWIEWPIAGRSEPLGWTMRTTARRPGSPFTWTLANGSAMRPEFEFSEIARLRGLAYYTRPGARRGKVGGMLFEYTDGGPKPRKPRFVADKPRGGKRPHRTSANVASYLALRGATASPMARQSYQRPVSDEPALPPMYAPQDGVEEARAVLAKLRVDGSVPFHDLPGATLCKAATAKGARYIAGIAGSKETATSPAPSWQEPDLPLGDVLEEVAARGTLESIGVRLGYRGGYADRAGKRALLAEGRALVAANGHANARVA